MSLLVSTCILNRKTKRGTLYLEFIDGLSRYMWFCGSVSSLIKKTTSPSLQPSQPSVQLKYIKTFLLQIRSYLLFMHFVGNVSSLIKKTLLQTSQSSVQLIQDYQLYMAITQYESVQRPANTRSSVIHGHYSRRICPASS